MKKYSKLMSLVLRHQPEVLKLALDKNGWIKVDSLVNGIRTRYSEFTHDHLEEVVRTNDKKRFEFDVSGELIRACQGHSVEVDLQLPPTEPPMVLYHGTSWINAAEIMSTTGIKKMSRHAVQLSTDVATARTVGQRKGGETVLLSIASKRMYEDGLVFFRTTNNVWLTDEVPKQYIICTIR